LTVFLIRKSEKKNFGSSDFCGIEISSQKYPNKVQNDFDFRSNLENVQKKIYKKFGLLNNQADFSTSRPY
jgi:hypothetical protein